MTEYNEDNPETDKEVLRALYAPQLHSRQKVPFSSMFMSLMQDQRSNTLNDHRHFCILCKRESYWRDDRRRLMFSPHTPLEFRLTEVLAGTEKF